MVWQLPGSMAEEQQEQTSGMSRGLIGLTEQEQVAVWDSLWFVRFFQQGPVWLIHLFARLVTLVFLNRFVLW